MHTHMFFEREQIKLLVLVFSEKCNRIEVTLIFMRKMDLCISCVI